MAGNVHTHSGTQLVQSHGIEGQFSSKISTHKSSSKISKGHLQSTKTFNNKFPKSFSTSTETTTIVIGKAELGKSWLRTSSVNPYIIGTSATGVSLETQVGIAEVDQVIFEFKIANSSSTKSNLISQTATATNYGIQVSEADFYNNTDAQAFPNLSFVTVYLTVYESCQTPIVPVQEDIIKITEYIEYGDYNDFPSTIITQ